MNADIHRYLKFMRWNLSEMEAEQAGIRSAEDWHLAQLVGGAILLAGVLVIGLVLARGEPMAMGKKDRAKTAYGWVSVEKEAYIK